MKSPLAHLPTLTWIIWNVVECMSDPNRSIELIPPGTEQQRLLHDPHASMYVEPATALTAPIAGDARGKVLR
jgi:hypothetical protein